MITETRKQIIKLISPYMNKTLTEGCLFELNVLQLGGQLFKITEGGEEGFFNSWNIENERYDEFLEDDLINCDSHKKAARIRVIGHYDITAVLKYIEADLDKLDHWQMHSEIRQDEMQIYRGDGIVIGKIPNKPLHLYSEEEDEELLNLLNKLKTNE